MKLLPSDRFDLELSPVEGHLIEDELADLESFYDDECKKSRIEKPLSNPETLGDLITILGRVEER